MPSNPAIATSIHILVCARTLLSAGESCGISDTEHYDTFASVRQAIEGLIDINGWLPHLPNLSLLTNERRESAGEIVRAP